MDGLEIVETMADNVGIMMQHKIDAIERIMEFAENLALDHRYDKELGHRLKVRHIIPLFTPLLLHLYYPLITF